MCSIAITPCLFYRPFDLLLALRLGSPARSFLNIFTTGLVFYFVPKRYLFNPSPAKHTTRLRILFDPSFSLLGVSHATSNATPPPPTTTTPRVCSQAGIVHAPVGKVKQPLNAASAVLCWRRCSFSTFQLFNFSTFQHHECPRPSYSACCSCSYRFRKPPPLSLTTCVLWYARS
jgi:hypothetical protein